METQISQEEDTEKRGLLMVGIVVLFFSSIFSLSHPFVTLHAPHAPLGPTHHFSMRHALS